MNGTVKKWLGTQKNEWDEKKMVRTGKKSSGPKKIQLKFKEV
jgi:hypothetical protein